MKKNMCSWCFETIKHYYHLSNDQNQFCRKQCHESWVDFEETQDAYKKGLEEFDKTNSCTDVTVQDLINELWY